MTTYLEKIVGNQVVLGSRCTVTGDEYILRVPLEAFRRWREGELVQNVFPQLNADQREFLMTGTTPAEWDAMFPDDEQKGVQNVDN